MISSPLINALEEDELFLLRVLRSTERDPNLRLEKMEISTNSENRDKCGFKKINLRAYSPLQRKIIHRALLLKRQSDYYVRQKQLQIDPVFYNEATAYEHVIPTLKLLCRDSSMLPFPTCLFVSNSVIVLQDLVAEGYSSVNRLHGLDLAHTKLAIEALGKFHATSFALKYKNYAAFKKVTSQLKEVIFVAEAQPFFSASMEGALKTAITALKVPYGGIKLVMDDAIHKLQTLQGRIFKNLVSLVKPREPMSVICHGDFWINNILFHYKPNGSIDNVKFVDLQVFRYGSLATDLLHFLYTSLQPGLSNNHFDMLIDLYQASLNDALSVLAPNAPFITLDDIIGEIATYALYGLLMGFLLLPAITVSEEELNSCDTFSKKHKRKSDYNENTMKYSDRVQHLVLEFVERGFI